MARYDAYGFLTMSLEEAARFVESAVGVELDRRDSAYWGVYFCAGTGAVRNFMLYANTQGEWHTPEHESYGVVLLVNEMDTMDEIQKQLISGRPEPVLLGTAILPD